MKSSFLEKLLLFYEEDPGDPFNIYALALEYQKFDPLKAAEFFEMLLQKHPEYLPTYYHAAIFFANLDELEKADIIYKKGIKLAEESGNIKTHGELQRAYRMFLDDQEEW